MNRKKIRLFMFITLIIFILSQAANSQGFETDRALNPGNTILLRGSAKERIIGKLRLISNMESPLKILGVKNKLEHKLSCRIQAIAEGKIYELTVKNIYNESTRYRGVYSAYHKLREAAKDRCESARAYQLGPLCDG